MTIDEAIRILKLSIENSRNHVSFCFDNKGITALNMAIKALEQEPTVTSTNKSGEMTYPQVEGITPTLSVSENPNNCDLISRKALISHIENQSREWGEDYDAQQILGDIEDMPSVKPQEKTGHWIEKMDACECPYCHKAWDYCDNDTEEFDFCPKCGAKLSEIPTSSKPEISSYYGLKSYVRERSEE